MKNFWSKYKFSMIIIAYAALVVLIVYFLMIPMVRGIRLRSYDIQAKSIDREVEKSQISKLPEIEKEWTDFEGRQDSLRVILGQADQIEFIENVEAIAEKSNNKIELKIVDDSGKKAVFRTSSKEILSEISYPDYFPIQINLLGDYAGLVNFLHLLENSQFYVNIIALSSVKNTIDNAGNQNPFTNSASLDNASARSNQSSQGDIIKTEITAIVYTQKQ